MNKDVQELQNKVAQLQKDLEEIIVIQNGLVDEVNKKKWLNEAEGRITRNIIAQIGDSIKETVKSCLSSSKEKCPFQ